jgi:AraC-like DNA-binding protein
LSSIERDVIAEIRALRVAPENELYTHLLERPARLVHHFILASHGNVRLRFSAIAKELGIEMRTLERTFAADYRKTMMQFQLEVRLAFSKHLLSVLPPTKLTAIAALLGYDEVQDFHRFFKRHTHESPSAWSRRERERVAQKATRGPHLTN